MLELATTKQQPDDTSQKERDDDEQQHFHQPHFSDEGSPIQEGVTTPPPLLLPSNNKGGLIKRKLLLLSPLLICLYYVLTDTTHHHHNNNNNQNETQQQQQQQQQQPQYHLAFVTALSRHPPALRVFRIASESAFLLFCTAFALWSWETTTTTSCSCCSSSSSSFSDNHNNNNNNNETTITIPTQTVGKLLFAPPPNSITDNVAWMVYRKHHNHRLLFRRKRRKGKLRTRSGSSNDGRRDDGKSGRNEDDLIELQQQQQQSDEEEDDDDDGNDEGLSPLMMDTPSRKIRQKAHDLLDDPRLGHNDDDDNDDDADDNYIENGNRNDHDNTESLLETRNGTTTTSEETSAPLPKPPSSTSVLGAALDITTVMCIFLIFFTISSAEGGRYIDHKARGGITISPNNHINGENEDNNNEIFSYMKFFARIAAPLFPITLFLLSILLLIIPWRKRKVLWTIVSLTIGAPFYEVTFRDGFIGDILTSTVRPLQDLAYTVVFLFLGLQVWWSSTAYNTTTAGDDDNGIATITTLENVPLERSWLLHTLILPACTLSPLWWRFLQNLRQCFDTKQRWPYLGNAFKYMLAAEVAIFGMFDPSVKNHPVWIACFFGATLYQVWWDVFMDWGLLEWSEDDVAYQYYHSSSSSGSGRKGLFWWWPYKLRSRRAYPHRWIYYTIFILNFCLRFVGMITLIPPVYLSRTTGLIVNTWYDPDFQMFVGSLAASAEIFRRTIWALLRLEWEVIKSPPKAPLLLSGKKNEGSGITPKDDPDDDLLDLLEEETDMKPMAISSSSSGSDDRGGIRLQPIRISLGSLSDMSNLNDIQILSELCAWATIFSGIAIIAAAHREIL